MTLSLRQVIMLVNGLNFALAGRSKIVRQNNEDVQSLPVPFVLDADTLLVLAKNVNKATPIVQAYETARNVTVLEARQEAGGTILPNSVEEAKLAASLEKLLEQDQEVELEQVEAARFKLDTNLGLAPIIVGLIPILK